MTTLRINTIPSNDNYVRDYKQEKKTATKRGETASGSSSGDAKRHRARRKYEKKNGALSSDQHVDHKKTVKSGGGNGDSNLRARDASSNMSAGGKSGSSKGKAAGARKGHKSRKKKKGALSSD